MVKIGLLIKAQLSNVTDFIADGSDFRWYLKVCCSNCGELSKWVYAVREERVPLKGGRGSANLVVRCRMCGRENSLEILEDHLKPYKITDSGTAKVIAVFDCRGLEVVDFDPRNGFSVRGETSETIFSDISLSDKEWYDYDEKSNQPVSIVEFEHSFVKV